MNTLAQLNQYFEQIEHALKTAKRYLENGEKAGFFEQMEQIKGTAQCLESDSKELLQILSPFYDEDGEVAVRAIDSVLAGKALGVEWSQDSAGRTNWSYPQATNNLFEKSSIDEEGNLYFYRKDLTLQILKN